jgi:hypothetical protein
MRSKIRKALNEGLTVRVDCGQGSFREICPSDHVPLHDLVEDIVECAMRAPYCGHDSEDEGPANWQDRIMIEV